jgi:hypothetical protein
MSTPQTIAPVTHRFPIGHRPLLTAFGMLGAIVVTIIILALSGTNHSTGGPPPTISQRGASATPPVHYLGPRQMRAAVKPTTTRSGPAAGDPAAHYRCLGAARRCLR